MFRYDDMLQMVQQMARSWAETNLKPATDALESGELQPYALMTKLLKDLDVRSIAKKRFAAIEAAIEKGEADAPREKSKPTAKQHEKRASQERMSHVLSRELSRINPGFVLAFGASLGLAGGAIMNKGTDAQKLRWGKPILMGEKVGAWGMTEPGAGSDAFRGMRTTATPTADGYLLNGQKTFITNAPFADIMVIYAKIKDDDNPQPIEERPFHAFIVEKGMTGVSQPPPMRKMGMHSSPTGEIFLEECHVGHDRLLGGPPEDRQSRGREGARAVFSGERTGLLPMCLGILDRCIEISTEYARTRKTWGRPIGDYQLVQEKLSRMFMARQNCENLLFKTWWLSSQGESMSPAEASACKLYSARVTTDAALEAVQLLGGNGYMAEYEVERLMRDAKLLQIGGGTDEIQIITIARAMLS